MKAANVDYSGQGWIHGVMLPCVAILSVSMGSLVSSQPVLPFALFVNLSIYFFLTLPLGRHSLALPVSRGQWFGSRAAVVLGTTGAAAGLWGAAALVATHGQGSLGPGLWSFGLYAAAGGAFSSILVLHPRNQKSGVPLVVPIVAYGALCILPWGTWGAVVAGLEPQHQATLAGALVVAVVTIWGATMIRLRFLDWKT